MWKRADKGHMFRPYMDKKYNQSQRFEGLSIKAVQVS